MSPKFKKKVYRIGLEIMSKKKHNKIFWIEIFNRIIFFAQVDTQNRKYITLKLFQPKSFLKIDIQGPVSWMSGASNWNPINSPPR